jgi:hypothetical protein
VDRTFDEMRETARWEEFAKRNAQMPFLDSMTLYSLSESIIDSIKRLIPVFFTSHQERFERDLASTATFGFFCRRTLGSSASGANSRHSSDDRHARSDKAIKELLVEEYRRTEADEPDIEVSIKGDRVRRKVVGGKQDAYVGWLVTNRQFKAEVGVLRTTWEAKIQDARRFPRFPHWPLYETGLPSDTPEDLTDDFLAFYRRWNLIQMLTWEWPEPMPPDIAGIFKDRELLEEGGLRVFMPWYTLRGEKLNLQELVRHRRAAESPPHLREWLQKNHSKKDGRGDVHYQRLAFLYRFLDLALRQRYGDAFDGRAEKLDATFGWAMNLGEERVRQLRENLQRALRGGSS